MKVVYRQPMTCRYWPTIIVEAANGYYMITQRFFPNDDYPHPGSLSWEIIEPHYSSAPITGFCQIQFGSELIPVEDGQRFDLVVEKHIAYLPEGFESAMTAMCFRSFLESRDWFLALDPIPIIMKILL